MTDYIDIEEATILSFRGASQIQNDFIAHYWEGTMITREKRQEYQSMFFDFLTNGPGFYSFRKEVLVASVQYVSSSLTALSTAIKGVTEGRQNIIDDALEKINTEALSGLMQRRLQDMIEQYKQYEKPTPTKPPKY